MQIPFGSQSYRHASLPLSAQRMVNCYLEAAPPDAKTLAAVVPCFGMQTLSTVGTGFRGGLVVNDVIYAVSGHTLYQIQENGTATVLGTIPGTDRVSMAADETHVMVVTGGWGYVYNGSSVASITDPEFPGAQWVENFDGYFVVGEPDSGKFAISANRDPTQWDGLDFASAEKYPDNLVRGIAQLGELVLFGKESGEVWTDTGAADFPLERSSAGIFELGTLSRDGPAKGDNTIFFPGHDGIVYRLNGYTPQRISTVAVEQAIRKATDKDFRGMCWVENGHTFYGLFSADFGFVYDCSTQLWWERQSFNRATWRAAFAVIAHKQLYVGDTETGTFGMLSPDVFSDFGEVLRLSCTAPAISQENKRLTLDRLELVFEQGVGLPSGQGADPQVMLHFSKDGGRTWGPEKWRSLGKMGEFRRRAVWNRLGQARDWVPEYAISDPVRRTLILATADVTVDAA